MGGKKRLVQVRSLGASTSCRCASLLLSPASKRHPLCLLLQLAKHKAAAQKRHVTKPTGAAPLPPLALPPARTAAKQVPALPADEGGGARRPSTGRAKRKLFDEAGAGGAEQDVQPPPTATAEEAATPQRAKRSKQVPPSGRPAHKSLDLLAIELPPTLLAGQALK